MKKITFLKNFFFGLCGVILLFGEQVSAQIVISQPVLAFTQACANDSFNTFNTTFTFTTGVVTASNQFIIELSDPSGDFSSATIVLETTAGTINTSPATLTFSFPFDTAGEAYKIRVRSTDPVGTSAGSVSFAAYYKPQDTPFSINNLVDTGSYCLGGGYLLTIDNPGTGLNDSPLNYSSLTFNWFKETGATTSVQVHQGNTFLVNEEGTFFAETNYGGCTSNSFSNRVTISEATTGAEATIASSLGNPFCASDGLTSLSTIQGQTYQWYNNGSAIEGAINQTYETDQAGDYSVSVSFGGCEAAGSIELVAEDFSSTIDVVDGTIVDVDSAETLPVTVSTTAVDPSFQWYLNNNPIAGATSSTYVVDEGGDYSVIVTQTTGCVIANGFIFTINTPIIQFPDVTNIPNLVSPNGDGINDTWIIPIEYVSGTETEVTVMSSQGEILLQTNDYQNNWPVDEVSFKSVNPVYYYMITTPNQETKKGSITIVK